MFKGEVSVCTVCMCAHTLLYQGNCDLTLLIIVNGPIVAKVFFILTEEYKYHMLKSGSCAKTHCGEIYGVYYINRYLLLHSHLESVVVSMTSKELSLPVQ